MSQEHGGTDYGGALAAADLTLKRYYGVKLVTGANTVNIATANCHAIGILQNAPDSGEQAVVRYAGFSKAKAGDVITRDDPLMFDSSGRVVTATAPGYAAETPIYSIGRAMESATAADEIIEILIQPCIYGS